MPTTVGNKNVTYDQESLEIDSTTWAFSNYTVENIESSDGMKIYQMKPIQRQRFHLNIRRIESPKEQKKSENYLKKYNGM